MLKSFMVDNFKTFDRPVTIDFSATGGYDFNCEAVKDGIVKTAVMYGKNASGKSSLALALFDIVSCLTDNYACPPKYSNYVNLDTDAKCAAFRYVFDFDGLDVEYSYSKKSQHEFVAERLVIDKKAVVEYDRQKSQKDFTLNMEGTATLQRDLRALKGSALKYIRYNALLTASKQSHAFDKLFSFADGMLLFWNLDDKSFIGYTPKPRSNMVHDIVSSECHSKLAKFFNDADIPDELQIVDMGGTNQIILSKYKNGVLELSEARSSGMSSLLLVFYWLGCVAKHKPLSFVCIDEFDAFYHFELSRFVVKMLKSLDVQSLVTTHNTSLLSNEILRPDCYYICSKEQITNLNHATDKQLRQVHNIENLYRGGTFGL